MQYVKAKEVVCKYLLSTLKLLVFSSSLVREWLHDQSAWYVSKFNERDCIWFMDHIPPQALSVHTVKSIYQTYWHINWCLWMDDFSFPWNMPSLVWDSLKVVNLFIHSSSKNTHRLVPRLHFPSTQKYSNLHCRGPTTSLFPMDSCIDHCRALAEDLERAV